MERVRAGARLQEQGQLSEEEGGVLLELPAACGAATHVCGGLYVPLPSRAGAGKVGDADLRGLEPAKVYQREDGTRHLYFYEPFDAWMVGS